jgi:hypothetical protein
MKKNLQFLSNRVMDDNAAVITAKENLMINSIASKTDSRQTENPLAEPNAKDASRAHSRVHVSKKKSKPTPKGSSTQRAKKLGPAKATRKGTKMDKVLVLLKRPGGASANELMKATGWQAHSVRGFLSGTVAKKLGLTLISVRDADGRRSYRIKQ